MLDPELLEWITARRAEPDELEGQLAKQLVEMRAERDELTVAERVLDRVSVQLADERASAAPSPGHLGGRAVMLIPHRMPEVEETVLPPDYQRILAAVRQAAGPVMALQVGEILGVDVTVRAKLEPLRGRLVRLADRGWLRKPPDSRFTTRQRLCGDRPPLARRADRPARRAGTAPGPRPEEGRQAGRGGGPDRPPRHPHPAPHREGRPAELLRQTPPSPPALPRSDRLAA
ncbi:hypothetical protein ABTY63_45190 [Streptomyces solisilvae]|uniref:hypothetical protein n=1 Tax=Streptomyces malaysiensis TaxID=92644 RepID=UPI00332963C2